MAVNIKYHKIIKYLVKAVCTQPLHIGSASGEKEEVLVHPADGRPFIQASGLSGVLRKYYAETHGREQAEKLFGASRVEADGEQPDGASRVRFGDGIFSREKLVLELRPRVAVSRETGTFDGNIIKGTDKLAGHKFNMEYIGAGASFEFPIYLYDESFQEDLEEVLGAVHQGDLQFGGQKSNGCGFLKLCSLKRKTFDLTRAEDRRSWADEEVLADREYEELLSGMKKAAKKAMAYEVTVTGRTEGELLVKSIAVEEYGKDAPDSMNIRNAAKEYIVPGSSFKGAVRNQMEKIASYIGREGMAEEIFGKAGDSRGGGKSGNIVFCDTVVGKKEDNDRARIKNRIHIDKFTGGVIHGGLFQEKNVSGSLAFHILISGHDHPDSTCGLLLMALRDLAVGVMSVGSGYSVGKGIIHVDSIVVYDCRTDGEAVMEFEKGTISDGDGLIERCMRAVRSEEAAG